MVVAVHLFLLKDNQILLSRRFQTGYEDGNYSLPAGHVEANESVVQALIRETREEIGISLRPENLLPAHVMHRLTDRESIDFFFACQKWTGKPVNTEPEKCDELSWFSIDALPSNIVGYVKKAILHYQAGRYYSELGW